VFPVVRPGPGRGTGQRGARAFILVADKNPDGARRTDSRTVAHAAHCSRASGANRELDAEGRANAGLAFHGDETAEQFRETARERQSESAAFRAAMQRRIDLRKLIENPLLILR